MASYTLKNAEITFSDSAFSGGEWILIDAKMDVTSTTDTFVRMGGDGWTETVQSAKSVSYSWTTHLDDTLGIDLDNTAGVEGTLTFDTVEGLSYTSEVIIIGSNITGDSTTIVSVAWTADANGDVTENVS